MASARCCVCAHAERTKIEALVAGGNSMTAVASQFGVDRSQLSRHMNGTPKAPPHVTPAEMSAYICGASQVEELRLIAAKQSGTILEDLRVLKAMTFKQIHDAATVKDATRFSALAGRMLDILESLGQRTGEIARLNPGVTIDQSTHVSITASPQFVRLQRGLMRFVMNHPEHRAELFEMLSACAEDHERGTMIELDAAHAA